MNDTQSKRVLTGVGVLLSICLFCCLACYGGTRVLNEFARIEVERAARRVGTEPTINGLAEYIIESVEVGMSREQAEQILGTIAPLEVVRGTLDEELDAGWGPTACDKISLKLSPLPGHKWRIIACYDSKGGLVLLKSADPDSFPSLDIYAPIQR